MQSQTQAAMQSLIDQISDMVKSSNSLEQLQEDLINSYGDLDTSELTNIMSAGFMLAQLHGINDVKSER